MGYEARRWLADRLPPGLSPGERLVALEIADLANDRTRRAFGADTLAKLVRRTGYANIEQVGKILSKLARRGLEFRVPVMRNGRPGAKECKRPVFACSGHELNFRIPDESCPALVKPAHPRDLESPREHDGFDEEGRADEEEGRVNARERSRDQAEKTACPRDPSPQSPQDSSSLPARGEEPKEGEREDRQKENQTPTPKVHGVSADLAERVMAKTKATAAEFVAVIEAARRAGVHSPGPWLRSDAGAENFLERLAALRAAPSAPRSGQPGVADYRAAVRAACEHGTPGGADRCPLCRRQAPARPPVAEDQPLEVPKPRGGQLTSAFGGDRSGPPTASGRDTAIAGLRALLADKQTHWTAGAARVVPPARPSTAA